MSATLALPSDLIAVSTDIGQAAVGHVEPLADGRRLLWVAVWVRYRAADGALHVVESASASDDAEGRVRARRRGETERWMNAFARGVTSLRVETTTRAPSRPTSWPTDSFLALEDGDLPQLRPGQTVLHADPEHDGALASSALDATAPLLIADGEVHPMRIAAMDFAVRNGSAWLVFAERIALGDDLPTDIRVMSDSGAATMPNLDVPPELAADHGPSSRGPRRKADTAHLTTQDLAAISLTDATPFRSQPPSQPAPARPSSPLPPRPSPPPPSPRPSPPPSPLPPPTPPPRAIGAGGIPGPPAIPGSRFAGGGLPRPGAPGGGGALPFAPRPPNPAEAVARKWVPPASSAPASPAPSDAEASKPREAPQREVPAHGVEVLWLGDDDAVLERARAWAHVDTRPRGLLSRIGRDALRDPAPPKHAWLADGRVAQKHELRSAELLFRDQSQALTAAAVVVAGELAFDVPLHDELEAIRAALRHLTGQSKPIREALEATDAIAADPLTPVRVLRAGIDEILAGVERANMAADGVRRTARHTLIRTRRHAELNVLGDDHIVARWTSGGGQPWVAYLPKSALAALPLEPVLSIRAAVTVHPRQDPEEPGAHALRIHALARVVATADLVDVTDDQS